METKLLSVRKLSPKSPRKRSLIVFRLADGLGGTSEAKSELVTKMSKRYLDVLYS